MPDIFYNDIGSSPIIFKTITLYYAGWQLRIDKAKFMLQISIFQDHLTGIWGLRNKCVTYLQQLKLLEL